MLVRLKNKWGLYANGVITQRFTLRNNFVSPLFNSLASEDSLFVKIGGNNFSIILKGIFNSDFNNGTHNDLVTTLVWLIRLSITLYIYIYIKCQLSFVYIILSGVLYFNLSFSDQICLAILKCI